MTISTKLQTGFFPMFMQVGHRRGSAKNFIPYVKKWIDGFVNKAFTSKISNFKVRGRRGEVEIQAEMRTFSEIRQIFRKITKNDQTSNLFFKSL